MKSTTPHRLPLKSLDWERLIPLIGEARDALARYELGCGLVKTGRWAEALPQFEAAVSQMKSSATMHFYLALVYQRNSRVPDASNEFRSALRIDPDNFPANLLLGRLLLKQQEPANALPYLRKATSLHADSIDAHLFLADALSEAGQLANARREREEAERIRLQGGSRLGTSTKESGAHRRRP